MSELSTCCDAERWRDLESDICGECKEHADFYNEDENDELCGETKNEAD